MKQRNGFILKLSILCIVIAGFAAAAWAATCKWDGGGTVGSWADKDNWGGTNWPGTNANDTAHFVNTLPYGYDFTLLGSGAGNFGTMIISADKDAYLQLMPTNSSFNYWGFYELKVAPDATLILDTWGTNVNYSRIVLPAAVTQRGGGIVQIRGNGLGYDAGALPGR